LHINTDKILPRRAENAHTKATIIMTRFSTVEIDFIGDDPGPALP
jgi:hypothetical protein